MRRPICLFILFMLLSVSASAQSFTATISGTAKDPSGAVLPGVQITAVNSNTNLSRTVVTNERGDYVIPLLPVGTYQVTAELPGFKSEIRQGIVLQVDQRISVDFSLQLGEVSEKLLVTEAAPLVQSETSSLGDVIENRRVVELPLNGREFQNLTLLVPGAFNPAQGTNLGYRGGITVAGAREEGTAFSLDGVDMVNGLVRMVSFKPSIDAIQEFKVQTSSYSAEYGRSAGGQVSVTTKSGTNEFHGTVFEFLRNSAMDAKNYFDPPGKIPGFRRNNFGATIGGPIVHDRTFFFFDYEGLRLNQAITKTAAVPTLQMLSGDFSNLSKPVIDPLTGQQFQGNIIPSYRINPVGAAISHLFPAPNLQVSAGNSRNFVSSPPDLRYVHQITSRLDHRFSDKNNIFGRYSLANDLEYDPFDLYSGITNLPGYGRYDRVQAQSVSIVDTHVFSPSLVAEVRLGYNRYSQLRHLYPENRFDVDGKLGITGNDKTTGNLGYPAIRVTGYDNIGKTGYPTDRSDNTYELIGNVTYTHGNHTLKVGIDGERMQSFRLNNGTSQGDFRFTGEYTGNAVADLLLGIPRQTSRNLGDTRNPIFTTNTSIYAQDDWKVTPRLTFNLGLRYEINTPLTSSSDRLSTFDPTTGAIIIAGNPSVRRDISRPDQFDPDIQRLEQGIQFINLGKRKIYNGDHNNFAPRMGFAYRMIGNDRLVMRGGYGIFYNLVSGNSLISISNNFPFRVSQTFNGSLPQPNIFIQNPFPAGLGSSTFSPTTILKDFPTGYVHQYNLGFQYQMTQNMVIDIGYAGSKSTKLLRSNRDLNQPFASATGSVASRRPYQGWGNLPVLESAANAHFDSLQLRVEQRFSAGFTLLGAYTFSKSIDDNSGGSSAGDNNAPTDHHNYVQTMRGRSMFDATQRLVMSYVYQLPLGSGHRLMGNLTGVPGWFVRGWELSGISTFQTGRPFTVYVSSDISNTGNNPNDRPNLVGDPYLPSSQRTPDHWFNTKAFAVPARGTIGNLGRNTLTAPGNQNSDFSLIKNSPIGERKNIQFRAEIFNILNHPNFDMPKNDVLSAQFGQIFSAEFSRQIQLGLKLVY